jgi:two-component system chemotaxis response regulator CheB
MADKILVVDDSALMRRLLTGLLTEAGYAVVCARNGAEGVQMLIDEQPVAVTLDINMPEMDGLTALSLMMQARPTPVIMVSSLTEKGARATLEALALGAVDFVAKPGGTISLSVSAIQAELLVKLRAALGSRPRRQTQPQAAGDRPASGIGMGMGGSIRGADAAARRAWEHPATDALRGTARSKSTLVSSGALGKLPGVVIVGVSTGGPRALEDILPQLPGDFPWPILVAQHMPPNFTDAFARRMDSQCALQVRECADTLPLEPGLVVIGKGGTDMVMVERLGRLAVQPRPETPGHPWHPSADVLVGSALRLVPPRQLIGVLLTGMGDDGARAMTELKQQGGRTIAEAESSCVVFGMPRELIELGGASLVLPCSEVPRQLVAWTRTRP